MGKINDSAPAPRDGAAAAGVRVGAGAGPAVVVRRAAPGAGHGVPLQRPVADVAARRQDAPVRLRVQIELPLAVAARRQALGYRPLAARSAGAAGPPQAVAVLADPASVDGGGEEARQDEGRDQEEAGPRRRREDACHLDGAFWFLGFCLDE